MMPMVLLTAWPSGHVACFLNFTSWHFWVCRLTGKPRCAIKNTVWSFWSIQGICNKSWTGAYVGIDVQSGRGVVLASCAQGDVCSLSVWLCGGRSPSKVHKGDHGWYFVKSQAVAFHKVILESTGWSSRHCIAGSPVDIFFTDVVRCALGFVMRVWESTLWCQSSEGISLRGYRRDWVCDLQKLENSYCRTIKQINLSSH